jgi:hypothetical protein
MRDRLTLPLQGNGLRPVSGVGEVRKKLIA